jgi:hypothetical protein
VTGPGTAKRLYAWVISDPVATGVAGPRVPQAETVRRLEGYVVGAVGAAVGYNVEERSTIGSTGADILSADQWADLDGAIDTSFDNPGLASGAYLWVDISGVTGTVSQFSISLETEV